jgi:hypothetical protein
MGERLGSGTSAIDFQYIQEVFKNDSQLLLPAE